MAQRKIEVDKDELIRLYFSDKLSFSEIGKKFGCDAQTICKIIFSSPGKFLSIPPKKARGRLYRVLRNNGWSWPRIWNGFKEIKKVLK